MGSSSSLSSHKSNNEDQLSLPKRYLYLQTLGQGGFGKVIKCFDLGTCKNVAVKINKRHKDHAKEVSILKFLMQHKMHRLNIVKCYGECVLKGGRGIVFEALDISLLDYINDLKNKLPLEDIRNIIQQMTEALGGLKNLGVIHTDLKLDNIVIVNRKTRPLKVKLVDFGLAIFKSEAKLGRAHQVTPFRAPEIILGLPYCESIDIWSLGCLMAIMVLGCILFPGKHEYDTLRFIHNILGPPPDYLLSAGKKSKLYFTKTDSNRWTLKTPKEYWGTTSHSTDNRCYTFCSLDEAEKVVIEKYPREEAIRRLVCIDLLEAMLKWDPQERRTPSEILQHPFFTLDHLNMSDQRISNVHATQAPSTTQSATRIQQDATGIQSYSTCLPPDTNKTTKNCFKCLWSCMKRNACVCSNKVDVME